MDAKLKKNIKNVTVAGEPSDSLTDIIARMSLTQLRTALQELSSVDIRKKKAGELAATLEDNLTNPDTLRIFYTLLPDEAFICLDELSQLAPADPDALNEWIDCYAPSISKLCKLRYLWFFKDHNRFILSKTFRDILDQNEKHLLETRLAVSSLHTFTLAAVALYGFIDIPTLAGLFSQFSCKTQTGDELINTLHPLSLLRGGYDYTDGYIVSELLYDGENSSALLNEYIRQAQGKPRYLPDWDTFITFADPDYVQPTPANKNFLAACKTVLKMDNATAAALLIDLTEGFQADRPFGESLETIAVYYGKDLNEKQLSKIIPAFQNLSNGTRLWVNNGHTPDELFPSTATAPSQSLHSHIIKRNNMDADLQESLNHLAITGQPADSLWGILAGIDTEQLRKIAGELPIETAPQLDKAALTAEILRQLTDPTHVTFLFSLLPPDALECLEELGQEDPEEWLDLYAPAVQQLCEMRILWPFQKDGGYTFIYPKEYPAILEKNADQWMLTRETFDSLDDAARAAVNLYGVISLDAFATLFIQGSQSDMPPDLIEEMLGTLSDFRQEYDFDGDHLYNLSLADEDSDPLREDIIKKSAGKPRYTPAWDDFLEFAEEDYVEPTPANKNFLQGCQKALNLDELSAETVLLELITIIRLDEPDADDLLDAIATICGVLSKSQAAKLLPLAQDLLRNTRLWTTNGHTLNELA